MRPTVLKACKIHGLIEHRVDKDGRTRCKKCSVEQVTKRRRKVKAQAVEYKNNVCAHCGNTYPQEVYDFHHLDPNEKDFGIATKGYCLSWERVKVELDKCVMLCANCHRIEHARLLQV